MDQDISSSCNTLQLMTESRPQRRIVCILVNKLVMVGTSVGVDKYKPWRTSRISKTGQHCFFCRNFDMFVPGSSQLKLNFRWTSFIQTTSLWIFYNKLLWRYNSMYFFLKRWWLGSFFQQIYFVPSLTSLSLWWSHGQPDMFRSQHFELFQWFMYEKKLWNLWIINLKMA